ncbi:hypothetical protein GWI72_01315 [Microvirga tunisiensis]|uniref:Uncharacterized protein n=2 Tax=Pannonibacter tanglangensis TaxID=2750084 RepID=A0ABW9ZH41_9HYPH|nr:MULTISPECIES: hypothetical protein [unclassified Pannonibacter]NBN63262.1 hypothetical protein [Pannonibacter sp. XCT-34]NBN76901.1 hypothetical protein [Pannonibacter sp. XCT-53]
MTRLAVTTALLALMPTLALANDFKTELTALAKGPIAEIVQAPEVIAALKAQNAETAGYGADQITALDKTWRAEAEASTQPMIDKVLDNPLSQYLTAAQEASGGKYTEIFVMDAKGLNVGQSEVTSDYWQGDEDKWKATFLVGPGAVHISELERDDSTQMLQSQVSISITDPATGAVIGAVTVGVNVDKL